MGGQVADEQYEADASTRYHDDDPSGNLVLFSESRVIPESSSK